ncbi:MAG: hypothetical protein V3W18_00055 [candidate division Zixibacteria bacterium]
MPRKNESFLLRGKKQSKQLKTDDGKDGKKFPLQIRLHPNIDEILTRSVRRESKQ